MKKKAGYLDNVGRPVHPTRMTTKILMFLTHQDGKWATWGPSMYMPSVQQVFPVGTSEKVQLRVMQKLQQAELVNGCDCGCRGDYVPTEKGLQLLESDSSSGAQEATRFRKEARGFGY